MCVFHEAFILYVSGVKQGHVGQHCRSVLYILCFRCQTGTRWPALPLSSLYFMFQVSNRDTLASIAAQFFILYVSGVKQGHVGQHCRSVPDDHIRAQETEQVDGSIHGVSRPGMNHFNPLVAKWINLNFHPLEIVSRWRDPQLQVSENYSDLTKWR